MKPAILAVVCGFCLFSTGGLGFAQEKPPPSPPGAGPMTEGTRLPEPGTVAPDFTLRDTEGTQYALSESRGKRPVLVVFWSLFCEPCRQELPMLQKIHSRHGGQGLDVVAVSLDGEPLKGVVAGFLKQDGYTFRVLIDEVDSMEMFKAAGAYGVARSPSLVINEPALCLVDRSGKVAFSRSGRLREEELEKALQAVLKR